MNLSIAANEIKNAAKALIDHQGDESALTQAALDAQSLVEIISIGTAMIARHDFSAFHGSRTGEPLCNPVIQSVADAIANLKYQNQN